MRLSTRLSIFFLATLALILVAFSTALLGLASSYLKRQADERLEAALNTLVASAEVHGRGVEWEPEERQLSFGRGTVGGRLLWVVSDGRGRRIDGSTPAADAPAWPGPGPATAAPDRPSEVADREGRPWLVRARRLVATGSPEAGAPGSPPPPGPESGVHESLVVATALSLAEFRETFRSLALTLAALSVGAWTLALLIGDRLCRRALRPVAAMAEAARLIAGHEFDERLPAPETGDELQDLGRAFNGLLGRHHESHERQRRFTGDASHQLRTPLTAMQGHVDLALRQARSVDEYRRVLSVVQAKTRHLRRIVEALLFLARADAESQRPRLESVELAGWLREHLASRQGARGADVRLDLGSDGPIRVEAHPTLLAEALDNLLDNAGKYSEPGTPIVVRASVEGGDVRLAVEDRGIGLEPGEATLVVDPFYRAPRARSLDPRGTGLGLAVVARIVESFGGRLEVDGQTGRGSTFAVVLPSGRASPP